MRAFAIGACSRAGAMSEAGPAAVQDGRRSNHKTWLLESNPFAVAHDVQIYLHRHLGLAVLVEGDSAEDTVMADRPDRLAQGLLVFSTLLLDYLEQDLRRFVGVLGIGSGWLRKSPLLVRLVEGLQLRVGLDSRRPDDRTLGCRAGDLDE